ncbi:anti-sigma-I factor RsgI family protein, partial [Oscillibacter sp.]|uniref:anti-sigma-I factor RsgI family protein n=1 Tax=Oscillibacter sp. TaxID=1945593 RepID=UPI002D7E937E
MKKNSTPKLFGLALTAALTLATLTACGSHAGTGSSQGAAGNSEPVMQADAGGSVGTVLLSVNPEIEIDYDKAGNVVALTGLNADGQAVLASYTGYEGKACTAVVSELVDEINAGGYFDATIDGHEKNIVLKMERGSAYPSDQFLNDLAEAVRLVVEADQIGSETVALDSDDYDDAYGDKGYINAAAAQNILSAQLGRNDIQFVEKDYDLDDGEYEVEFVLDG